MKYDRIDADLFNLVEICDIVVDHIVAGFSVKPQVVYVIVPEMNERHEKPFVADQPDLLSAAYGHTARAAFIPLSERPVKTRLFNRLYGVVYGDVYVAALKTLYNLSHDYKSGDDNLAPAKPPEATVNYSPKIFLAT